jgi:hypothetical protein
MSAIVNLRVFRNFQQFVSIRPISNYPTSFRKKKEIQKVDGNFHIFKLALSIIRLFTPESKILLHRQADGARMGF